MSEQRLPSYGGQALIEGVLMRGSKYVVASMRRPDGEIERVEEALGGIYKTKIRDIPVMRGLVILWDSLGLGLKYLTVSANVQTGEEEKIEKSEMVITLIISLAISVLLFFVAPAWLGQLMKTKLGISQALSNIFEGLIRLLIVIGYMVLVSRMEEIKRVFRYHGAEHKTINAFDNGCQITIENVRAQSRLHPRCGTAFMVTVVLISIILFIIIGPLTPTMTSRLISRIILIPVISGIAYEYIRWNAKHLSNPIVKLLYYPNLAVQKITTAEPDDSMLECAISSFLRVLELENVKNETLTEANGEKKACVPVEKNTSL
ncbi:MAG: DUF1385 domain-containing protein [Chloroflexi bacterium]|nr:DUF1385 domain-containing protein [Chloroflexota bacterium]